MVEVVVDDLVVVEEVSIASAEAKKMEVDVLDDSDD